MTRKQREERIIQILEAIWGELDTMNLRELERNNYPRDVRVVT